MTHPLPPNKKEKTCQQHVNDMSTVDMNEAKKEDWEEEFDRQFGKNQYGGIKPFRQDKVKSFISTLLSQAKQEERERIVKYAEKQRDDAEKEAQINAKNNPIRRGVNLAEFGRFQAFRDLIKNLITNENR